LQTVESVSESLDAYEAEISKHPPDTFDDETTSPIRTTLTTFLDGVLGRKRRGDSLEEVGPEKRAQVMVSIKSDGTLSTEAEEKIEPIIKTEIRGWFEGGKVIKPSDSREQQIMVRIDPDTKREPQYAVTMSPSGSEVVKRDVTYSSVGPVVHKDIQVRCVLNIFRDHNLDETKNSNKYNDDYGIIRTILLC